MASRRAWPLTEAVLLLARKAANSRNYELAEAGRNHADLFAGVLPVIGLLAEAARTGGLREHHARLLAELARDWSPEDGCVLENGC
jgi:hypothetical protein